MRQNALPDFTFNRTLARHRLPTFNPRYIPRLLQSPTQPAKCTSPPSSFLSSSPSYPAKEKPRPYHIPTPSATNQASTATNSLAPVSQRTSKALAMTSTSWISAGGWRFFLTQLIFSVRRGPDSPYLGGVTMGVCMLTLTCSSNRSLL